MKRFVALGTTFEVRVSGPEVAAAVETITALYAPATGEPDVVYELGGGPPYALRKSGELLYEGEAELDLPPAFEQDLYRTAVARAPGWPLHAGAVQFGGAALVLAGASGAGKSTMTLALLERGAGYVTDEIAVVGPALTVSGLARPIGLAAGRAPSGFLERESRVIDASGALLRTRLLLPPASRVSHATVPVGLVIALEHAAAQPPMRQRLSGSEALRRLWDQSWRNDAAALEVAGELVSRVPVVSLRTRAIDEAATDILDAWSRR
jgi:hypothetical protein